MCWLWHGQSAKWALQTKAAAAGSRNTCYLCSLCALSRELPTSSRNIVNLCFWTQMRPNISHQCHSMLQCFFFLNSIIRFIIAMMTFFSDMGKSKHVSMSPILVTANFVILGVILEAAALLCKSGCNELQQMIPLLDSNSYGTNYCFMTVYYN